jgi:PAS domain S-box-containing protein
VELRRAELDFTARRVVTRPDFERALREFHPDIIVSDHQLPQFSGVAALELARARAPHAPFILLTGSLDEETAVEYMKAGAADYILKGRLTRLGPAVRGALERERMTRQLREREEYFKSLIEQAMDIIAVLDADGAVRYASPSVLPLLGYGAEELVGQHIFDLVHPDDIGPALRVFAEGVATGQGGRLLGLQVRHKDGTYRSLEAIGRFLLDDPVVRGVVINARDVTERRSLERQLLQAQKMEAVGRLAGGIAHDFNNVLTAIFGYADLLTEELPAGSPARQDLEEIRKAATRASALTRQLLAFSRQQVLAPMVLSVNDLVADVDKMLRRLVGEDVDLRLNLARDAGNVRADSGQLQQVIMNLVVNARDAMPTGGKLVIETADAELTEQYAELHQAVISGRYVMLAVSDTGVGMDAQTKARIFEPFFTTKEKGKGTGLGLSTVYGIVKQSGGYVWVYSELGHGTTIKLYLPRVDAPAEPQAPPRETATLTGTETILLAEDDDILRPLTKGLLAKLGYTVLDAESAEQALAVAGARQGPIHLLVADVVMPGASGRELARRLAQSRPETRVLYVSGYTDDAIVHHGMLDPGLKFLQKPFTPAALARKVRDVLDAT